MGSQGVVNIERGMLERSVSNGEMRRGVQFEKLREQNGKYGIETIHRGILNHPPRLSQREEAINIFCTEKRMDR